MDLMIGANDKPTPLINPGLIANCTGLIAQAVCTMDPMIGANDPLVPLSNPGLICSAVLGTGAVQS